ncbi:hypothetical protein ACTOS9_21220 [Bacillus subtilis]|uniref:Uncharacterized protein n=1 Tax=Bacillus subtilis TaxID=1423 RepID=A0AAX3RT40_BACIU|nr:hypothetical protein [Bacillus subtilis]PLV31799.1 hypothetical protein BSP4_43380 [Bacillus subtilis subsp. subtilis]WEY85319.1 hypothetical protein P5633_03580 [Bacillus subtilis]WEZ05120.1 hypothetical protein P5666_03985 [Bacillus subtilis]
MKKSEFKDKVFELLDYEVEGLDLNEKLNLVRAYLIEKEKDTEYDDSNKGKEWSDDELRIVLSFSPTKANCLFLAKAFKRGYGSIEQIFRWAATSDRVISDKGRTEDKFIQQVKRVSKEVGWRV